MCMGTEEPLSPFQHSLTGKVQALGLRPLCQSSYRLPLGPLELRALACWQTACVVTGRQDPPVNHELKKTLTIDWAAAMGQALVPGLLSALQT